MAFDQSIGSAIEARSLQQEQVQKLKTKIDQESSESNEQELKSFMGRTFENGILIKMPFKMRENFSTTMIENQ